MNDSWPIVVLDDDPSLHPLRDEAMKQFREEGGSFAMIVEQDGLRVQISVRQLAPTTAFVDEDKVRDPDAADVEYQLHKLKFSIRETRRELSEMFGTSQVTNAHFDYLDKQYKRVVEAINSMNHANDQSQSESRCEQRSDCQPNSI